jgi:hypothetical protein
MALQNLQDPKVGAVQLYLHDSPTKHGVTETYMSQ